MPKHQHYIGERQGRLTIVDIRPLPVKVGTSATGYLCRCDCGAVKLLPTAGFSTKLSCGCLRAEKARDRMRRNDLAPSNTGTVGVYKTSDDAYIAHIGNGGSEIYLGTYATLDAAAAVRSDAEQAIWHDQSDDYQRPASQPRPRKPRKPRKPRAPQPARGTVCWHAGRRKYQATYRGHYIGLYGTEAEAWAAIDDYKSKED